jgi:hypothetical protein
MKSPNTLKSPAHIINTHASPNGRMDAIAYGVRARLEEKTGFSRRITDETINVARALGVADKEINTWAEQRLKRLARDEARLRDIKAILDRIRNDIHMPVDN